MLQLSIRVLSCTFLGVLLAGSHGVAAAEGPATEKRTASNPARRPDTGGKDSGPQELGVFFVGNSYTMGGGGQPRLLKELFALRGTQLRTGLRILGGETLQGHLEVNQGRMPQWREQELLSLLKRAGKSDDQIRARLAEERLPYAKGRGALDVAMSQGGPWDYLILQVGRDRDDPDKFGLPQALAEYARLARSANPQTSLVLCMTWADQRTPGLQPRMDASGRGLARHYGLRMAPVGTALHHAHAARPDLQIFVSGSDSHPGPDGAYLMACVLFATMTGENPELLPAPSRLPDRPAPAPKQTQTAAAGRTEAATQFLRRLAWTTYVENQRSMAQQSAR